MTDFGLKLKREDDLTAPSKRRKNPEVKEKKFRSVPVDLLSFSLFCLSPPFLIWAPQIRQQKQQKCVHLSFERLSFAEKVCCSMTFQKGEWIQIWPKAQVWRRTLLLFWIFVSTFFLGSPNPGALTSLGCYTDGPLYCICKGLCSVLELYRDNLKFCISLFLH